MTVVLIIILAILVLSIEAVGFWFVYQDSEMTVNVSVRTVTLKDLRIERRMG